VVTLDRQPINAVDMRTMDEVRVAFSEVAVSPSVRAVVFASAHETIFCAGADLRSAHPDGPPLAWRLDPGVVARDAFAAIRHCPVPVIAAVNGAAVGAGMVMAGMCDIIVAAPEAKFGATEINVGLLGAMSHLRRMVGEYRARAMFFTGELAGAAELADRGCVSLIVPRDELLERSVELARSIAAKSPIGTRLAKASINRTEGLELEAAYHLEQQFTSRLLQFDDSREAAEAFLEHREPQWRLE